MTKEYWVGTWYHTAQLKDQHVKRKHTFLTLDLENRK